MLDLAREIDRTVSSVRMMRTLAMRRLDPWTEEQQNIVQEMTTEGRTRADIAEALKRTAQSVLAKQEDLNLVPRRQRLSRHQWSDKNVDELLQLYKDGLPDEQIAQRLSFKVTKMAIISQRTQLGLAYPGSVSNYWTVEQTNVLHRLFKLGWSDKDIGEHMGRRPEQIRSRRSYLGLKRKASKAIPWPITDEEKLREMILAKCFMKEMIKGLSVPRSVPSLHRRLFLLGLARYEKSIPWTKEDEDVLCEMSKAGCSNAQIREKLATPRTPAAISMRRLSLKGPNEIRDQTQRSRVSRERRVQHADIWKARGQTLHDIYRVKKHNMGFDKTTKRKAGSVHYLNDDATD